MNFFLSEMVGAWEALEEADKRYLTPQSLIIFLNEFDPKIEVFRYQQHLKCRKGHVGHQLVREYDNVSSLIICHAGSALKQIFKRSNCCVSVDSCISVLFQLQLLNSIIKEVPVKSTGIRSVRQHIGRCPESSYRTHYQEGTMVSEHLELRRRCKTAIDLL